MRSSVPWRYRVLLWGLIVGATVTLRLVQQQSSLLFPSMANDALGFYQPLSHHRHGSSENATKVGSTSATYPPNVYVDPAAAHRQPLVNRLLLGPYATTNRTLRIPPHSMDAVVVAAGPDATLAASLHNLFHLCGFRRFILAVNNATTHCPMIFDLIPQHVPDRPHLCLDHSNFYSKQELHRIRTEYPNLHRGAPGKLKRGTQMVQVPRMGWYLQQFSKLRIRELVPDLSFQYLAVDGDLVFTRPFSFTVTDAAASDDDLDHDHDHDLDHDDKKTMKLVLPTTSKSPKHWQYFVDWIFGSEWNATDAAQVPPPPPPPKQNFVVGWMVLDQRIVQDMISDMDRLIVNGNDESNKKDVFPFSILNQGEDIIHQTFFSEFYVYARYALRHPANPYILQPIQEPHRNPGRFQKTCHLTKHVYQKAQTDDRAAPFMIWEEHKHHAFNSCPDPHTSSAQLTELSTLGIWHDFHPPPWGGGNQFLLALRKAFEGDHQLTVWAKSDAESKALIQNSSQALLANSITFSGKTDVLDALKLTHQLALVHRVDGPYYSTRYGQSIPLSSSTQQSQSQSPPPPPLLSTLPKEDQRTQQLNRNYACATVFQSKWSLEANVQIGLTLRNPMIIPNTVDPSLFYPKAVTAADREQPLIPPLLSDTGAKSSKKIRIVATSHSDNARKGFDTMMWLDAHLDWNRYEMVYMGGIPRNNKKNRNKEKKEGGVSNNGIVLFTPKNIQVLDHQLPSQGVSDLLRSGDIYLAPSRYEPASNAVLEALACGLPVVYQKGSSHGQLVGKAGRGFTMGKTADNGEHLNSTTTLLAALDEVVTNYESYVRAIAVPTITDVSRQYLSMLRWCFYMRQFHF